MFGFNICFIVGLKLFKKVVEYIYIIILDFENSDVKK